MPSFLSIIGDGIFHEKNKAIFVRLATNFQVGSHETSLVINALRLVKVLDRSPSKSFFFSTPPPIVSIKTAYRWAFRPRSKMKPISCDQRQACETTKLRKSARGISLLFNCTHKTFPKGSVGKKSISAERSKRKNP